MNRMSRLLLLLCLVLAVSACGFRPRGTLALAEDLGPVKVQTADPYSELAQGLSVALSRAGVKAAVEGEPSATLRVRNERHGRRTVVPRSHPGRRSSHPAAPAAPACRA